MVHCWEEYMKKVHNAVPLDPWSSNVQLLDILIEKRSSWLPWLDSKKSMARVGSMLTVGAKDSGWKENVEEPIIAGLGLLESEIQNIIRLNTSSNGDTAMDFLKVENMPDIQASIKSSTSFLASMSGGGSSSSSAQFDVKGSKTVNCKVSGVESHRVIWDTLMKMVSKRSSSTGDELPCWRPDISKPELQWSSKRGQALWVVTEVMYANNIKIEVDKQDQVEAKGNITTTKAIAKVSGKVDGTAQMDSERDGVWTVTYSQEKKVFPFAFRMKKLDYDAAGTLRTSKTPLRRNNSLMMKKTMHTDKLYHSSSVSRMLP